MTTALKRLFRQVFAPLLLVALGASGLAQARDPNRGILTIAQARALPIGSTVTVAGTVSTPPGAFASSFFDLGFGLQDASAGIFVSSQVMLAGSLGEWARVTGVLQDSSGLLTIVPATASEVLFGEDAAPVQPDFVATGQVNEGTEGRIVQVVGQVTQAVSSDLPYGYKFMVDDGSGPIQIFVNLQTGIDTSSLAVGDMLSVTGFSSQYETHYEIDPRRPRDVKPRRH